MPASPRPEPPEKNGSVSRRSRRTRPWASFLGPSVPSCPSRTPEFGWRPEYPSSVHRPGTPVSPRARGSSFARWGPWLTKTRVDRPPAHSGWMPAKPGCRPHEIAGGGRVHGFR